MHHRFVVGAALWFAGVVAVGTAAQDISDKVPLTFAVEHQHTKGSCKGSLTVDKWVFTYKSDDRPEDSRTWKVTEIKQVESKNADELVFRTRESGKSTLGQDRNYKFKVPAPGVDRAVVDFMNRRVS